MMSAITKI